MMLEQMLTLTCCRETYKLARGVQTYIRERKPALRYLPLGSSRDFIKSWKCPHIISPPGLSLSQAGLRDGDASWSLTHKAPCLAQSKAGSEVLRYEALGLILRLACDLPTMESMLETLCVLSSSAWCV